MNNKSIITCADRLLIAIDNGAMTDKSDPRLELARSLGRDIRRARIQAGLSQAALGDLVGVSRQAVSMWEKGINVPEGHRIRELHQKIDISSKSDDRIGLGLERSATPLPKSDRVKTYVAAPVTPGGDWFFIEDIGDIYSRRPPALGPADLVSCLLVGNNTMAPWRFPHDPVFYSLISSPRVGDHVLVGFRTSKDTREVTDKTPFAIKLLTGLSPGSIRLKQYYPDVEETWDWSEILTVYPIIDWKALYGPFPLD